MYFKYNKLNAQCMWCKRKSNPHPDYKNEIVKLQDVLIEQTTCIRQLGFNSKY